MFPQLTAARAVKLNGWVPPFAARLAVARAREAVPLRAAAQLRATSSTVRDAAAPVASLATFGALAATSPGSITAARVFTILALYGALIRILSIAPLGLQAASEAGSGLQRVRDVLLLPADGDDGGEEACGKGGAEQKGDPAGSKAGEAAAAAEEEAAAAVEDGVAVRLRGTFTWLAAPTPPSPPPPAPEDLEAGGAAAAAAVAVNDAEEGGGSLRDIDLSFAAGSLTAIIGPVGSGKSSLLLAALGELHGAAGGGGAVARSGRIAVVDGKPARGGSAPPPFVRRVVGRAAYAPQSAWVLNATVRDNITLAGTLPLTLFFLFCSATHRRSRLPPSASTQASRPTRFPAAPPPSRPSAWWTRRATQPPSPPPPSPWIWPPSPRATPPRWASGASLCRVRVDTRYIGCGCSVAVSTPLTGHIFRRRAEGAVVSGARCVRICGGAIFWGSGRGLGLGGV